MRKSRRPRPDTPSFNVLLNASESLAVRPRPRGLGGFDKEAVRATPEDHQQDEGALEGLGHYWYADRELAKFVKAVKERCPESLIIIVGDHGDRYLLPTSTRRRRCTSATASPSSSRARVSQRAPCCRMRRAARLTSCRLSASSSPRGFSYMAVGSSLTRTNRQGVNYGFFITRHAIGKGGHGAARAESVDGGEPPTSHWQAMGDYINGVRSVSGATTRRCGRDDASHSIACCRWQIVELRRSLPMACRDEKKP